MLADFIRYFKNEFYVFWQFSEDCDPVSLTLRTFFNTVFELFYRSVIQMCLLFLFKF